MPENYLAFDLGASSGRAIMGTFENSKLSLKEIHRFSNGAVEIDGSMHWNIDILWHEIKTGLKKAFGQRHEINSIAVDTWGVDYGLLKKDGTLAQQPYFYRDSRTEGTADEFYKNVLSRDKLYSEVGLQTLPFNTLFQLYEHLKKNPNDFEGAEFLMIPDLLNYFLTGKKTCEYTIASTSMLLDAEQRSWNYKLIRKAGIPENIFPEIAQPCSEIAYLSDELCKELDCPSVKVVHSGSHDTASAVASVPVVGNQSWAYLCTGTWALFGAELDSPVLTEKAQEKNYTNEGGICGKIRFLTNIMGMWLIQECRRIWAEDGDEFTFAELEEMASQLENNQFLIDPNDKSFMAPDNMPQAIIEFCKKTNQGVPESKSQIMRTIYESLALYFKLKIDELQNILGKKYSRLNVVGGACKDKFLMQLTADAVEIPVSAGPIEATATGNIAAQMIASGAVSNLEQARKIIQNSFDVKIYTPSNKNAGGFAEKTAKFAEILKK